MEERVELKLIEPVTKIVVGKKLLYKNGYIHKDLVEELLEDKKELLAKGKDTYEVFRLIGAVQCLKELLCSWENVNEIFD